MLLSSKKRYWSNSVKKMSFFILSTMLGLMPTLANAKYLCTYYAQISEHDKYNSQGKPLATSYTKASAASILRQDRANFHEFGHRDFGDTADCVMHSKQQRAKFEAYLTKGVATPYAIREIITSNPTVRVDLFTNHITVTVQ